jgi:hypothetical protein
VPRQRMFTRLIPIIVLLVAACSQSDSTQQDVRSLSSSAATVETTLSAYLERSIPQKFTQRALQEGKNEQEKLLSDLEGSTQQGSGTAARDIARSLIETTTRAQTAVAGSDRKGARQALEELKDPAQALRALASPAAGQ